MSYGELVRDFSITGDTGISGRTDTAVSSEALLHQEYARIHGLAWKFGIPESEIDDATQEVFAKAFASLKSFRGECELSTWLTRIAINHFTSRKQAFFRRLHIFKNNPTVMENAPDGTKHKAELNEEYDLAVRCVRKLPIKLREAFVLRYLEEMSCREVAETLEIPEPTVRTRIYHARRKLRDMMKGYIDDCAK